jgi:hypothetical protein
MLNLSIILLYGLELMSSRILSLPLSISLTFAALSFAQEATTPPVVSQAPSSVAPVSSEFHAVSSSTVAPVSSIVISSSKVALSSAEGISSNSVNEGPISVEKVNFPTAAYDTLTDDLASLISGLDPVKYYQGKIKASAWKSHRSASASEWRMVNNSKVKPIQKWMNKNKFDQGINYNTVFYPFAGADFLYAASFYPNVTNYVLVGLEPLGQLKNPDNMDAHEAHDYVQQIRYGMTTSNHIGFFRTESMKKDFKQEELDGTVHLVVWYLKRMGNRIQHLSYFKLDAQGNPHPHPAADFKNASGYRIDFFGKDGKVKHLAYLSVDLSDEHLNKKPEYMNYFVKFNQQALLLKSASYLLQYGYFSKMRNLVLKNSSFVIQDDSGIPYKYLKNWDLKLFGSYTKTLNMFKERFQPDLKVAMEKSETRVPFRIGYNLKHNEMTLMIARKK